MSIKEKLFDYGLNYVDLDDGNCVCEHDEFCDDCVYDKEETYDAKMEEQIKECALKFFRGQDSYGMTTMFKLEDDIDKLIQEINKLKQYLKIEGN